METSRRNLASVLLMGGSALAILGQITQIALQAGERTGAVVLMVLGLIFYLFGIWILRQLTLYEKIENVLSKMLRWLSLEAWRFFALLIAILLAILAHYAAGNADMMVSPVATWLAWLIAIILCVIGIWKYTNFNIRAHWEVIVLVLGFTFLGLLLRAIATDRIPIILYGDEASAGIFGGSILDGKFNNPFSVGWYSFPGLYFYIPAFSISVLGYTTAALRIPSAIAGALTVGSVYLLGQTLFDKRTGILAALLLAGFHFHIHFSRIGLNNIWDGLFFTTTITAAWYAWDKESRNAYVLTGLGLGLSQYFYPSSRVIALVVFSGIVLSGLFNFQKLKRAFPNLILMTVVAAIIFLPMAWYYIRFPDQYFAPMERVSILGDWLKNEVLITGQPAWQIVLKQLVLGVQSFTYLPLQHWYRPEVALLRPLPAGIFLLGAIYLLSRPKDGRTIIIVIWLILYVLLGGLSESTPASQRYVAAAPVCVLVIAIGINETLEMVAKLWNISGRIIAITAVVVAALISANDVNFYFNSYTSKSIITLDRTNGMIAQELANELATEPKGTQAFFFVGGDMSYFAIPSIPYLAHQVEGADVLHPWGSPDNPIPTSNHLVFIFLPQNTTDLQTIQTTYPGGTLRERKAENGDPIYWLYTYTKSH